MRKTSTVKANGKKSRPKTKLGIPDLGTRKPQCSEVLILLTQCGDISMPSMSSLPGIVLNHDWPSTRQWFCAIAFTLRSAG